MGNASLCYMPIRQFERVLLPSENISPKVSLHEGDGESATATLERQRLPKVYTYDFEQLFAALRSGEQHPSGEPPPTPRELALQGRFLEAVAHGPTNCMFGMYATEVAFHRYFTGGEIAHLGGVHADVLRFHRYFNLDALGPSLSYHGIRR